MKPESLVLTPRPRKLVLTGGFQKTNTCKTVTIIDPALGPEHYHLDVVAAGTYIKGGSAVAIARGQTTLTQLARANGRLPCMQIEDWPDFSSRGFMLDISRNKVPTMESLFSLVDLLAHLKYNELQLYTEHTFAYAAHALIWGDASPMTGDQYQRLDAYCSTRHIQLIPNQNSFGHMERWLKYPEYNYLAECPQGFTHPESGVRKTCGSILKPDEESLAFLGSLYDEFLPNFSSQYFNAGCDETWELGLGWSKPLVAVEGREEVYLRFLQRIHTLVESHQRIMQFWADIIMERPDLVARLPESVVPMIWGYDAAHPFDEQCRMVAECDRPFYVVPGNSSWNSFTGRHANMVENQRSAARHGLRNGATGYLLTSWGDNGNHQTWPTLLPALYLGATLSWYGDGYHDYDLGNALSQDYFDDESGHLADALIALAGLEDHTGGTKLNSNLTFDAFFANPKTHLSMGTAMNPALITNLMERLDAIREGISTSRPKCKDAGWLKDEMHLAVDMTRLGLRKLRSGPYSQEAAALRPAWQEVTGNFESIWLNRNRPGGLCDSSHRMRVAMPGEAGG